MGLFKHLKRLVSGDDNKASVTQNTIIRASMKVSEKHPGKISETLIASSARESIKKAKKVTFDLEPQVFEVPCYQAE